MRRVRPDRLTSPVGQHQEDFAGRIVAVAQAGAAARQGPLEDVDRRRVLAPVAAEVREPCLARDRVAVLRGLLPWQCRNRWFSAPAHRPPRSPIAAVYPSRRHLSAKVRSFVEFLARRYERQQDWSLDDLLQ
jgi:DNA-binding transcriptional LysR family regulator